MGWAKYHEDIIDAITDANFFGKIGNYITSSTDPPTWSCSYCHALFHSKNRLYEHIKQKHNTVSSMLIVNGKIVPNEHYVHDLKSLIAIRYDLHDAVYVDRDPIKSCDTLNEIDLTDSARQKIAQNKSVSIRIGEKIFTIYLISREHVNINKINSIINQWNIETSKRTLVTENFSASNEIEKKCIDGLYNYFIACVSTDKNKDSRYSDAYAILSDVVDILPAATTILKIIAFKFNWIEKLRVLCVENDIFSDIYDFMVNRETSVPHITDGGLRIFIEDDLDMIIQRIIDYQNKKYDYLEPYVESYPIQRISKIKDPNLKDKICLLCARMAIKKSNKSEARRYYSEIQAPFFDEEKREYIRTM